jgi:hypothetical protein
MASVSLGLMTGMARAAAMPVSRAPGGGTSRAGCRWASQDCHAGPAWAQSAVISPAAAWRSSQPAMTGRSPSALAASPSPLAADAVSALIHCCAPSSALPARSAGTARRLASHLLPSPAGAGQVPAGLRPAQLRLRRGARPQAGQSSSSTVPWTVQANDHGSRQLSVHRPSRAARHCGQ